MMTTESCNNKLTFFEETEPCVAWSQGYFPSLTQLAKELPHHRVISVIIPLYNEKGFVLERTIASLQAQELPKNFVLDVIIITDGMGSMDSSMKEYIGSVFDFEVSETMFPDGMGIAIIDAAPAPVPDGSISSLSLVLKQENHGKVNSQMWWIRAHVPACASEFAFGTDCGIVFSKTMLFQLVERLDSNEVLSAVTGFKRIMNAEIQGDGKWELLTDPIGYCLRKIQG